MTENVAAAIHAGRHAPGGADDLSGTYVTISSLTTSLATKLSLSGGTMTGLLILSADPTAALGAATKQYVDAHVGTTGADATTSSKGVVQLAGDLGGTAASPTTPTALKKASNLSDLANIATARTNLGLGTAALSNTSAFDAAGAATTAQGAAIAVSLQRASNLSDLASASTARTNLGLGTAATSAASAFVATAGSTMTGLLILSADPTTNLGAATKQYVDAAATGTITGLAAVATSGQYTDLASLPDLTALVRSADAVIIYSGTQPLRASITTDLTRRVRWVTSAAPSIATGFAISGDVWEQTS